jgi:hypothetical protein
MKNRILILGVMLMMVLIGACAFAPVERPVVGANAGSQERIINLPHAQAFEVAELAAKSMGYEILISNKASGYLKTNAKKVPVQGNANCGSWNGVPIQGTAASALEVRVSERDKDHCGVTVWGFYGTKFQGRNLYGMVTREETYRCNSLGAVENTYMQILTRLAENWSPKKEPLATRREKALRPQKSGTTERPVNKGTLTKSVPTSTAQNTSTAGPPPEPTQSPQLEKLEMLKSMGLLSEQEFQQEKVKLGLAGK